MSEATRAGLWAVQTPTSDAAWEGPRGLVGDTEPQSGDMQETWGISTQGWNSMQILKWVFQGPLRIQCLKQIGYREGRCEI